MCCNHSWARRRRTALLFAPFPRNTLAMVFERPLIDRGDILDALGPIRHRAELSYRWLRRNELLSRGIALRLRGDGTLQGSAIVMSALNRDVVAAVGADDLTLAKELSTRATRLEEQLGAWIERADLAQSHRTAINGGAGSDLWVPNRPAERWSRQALRWAHDDAPELLDELAAPAAELSKMRSEFTPHLPLAQVTLSRVWRIGRHETELRPLRGDQPFAFLSSEVLDAGLRLGDAVAVRHEEVSPGTVITTLDPAVDVARRRESLSGRRVPGHIEALLEERPPGQRSEEPAPLRRVA